MSTTSILDADIIERIAAEVARARDLHPPINSAHEGYAVILEELDEFKVEVWKKQRLRDRDQMLAELIQCAAMCVRVAVDIGLLKVEAEVVP